MSRIAARAEMMPEKPNDRRFMLFCMLAFGAGAWMVTLPMGWRPCSLVLGDGVQGGLPTGDRAFFLHALWWTRHALFELGRDPWFTPFLYAPEGQSFLFSTLTPLYGVVSAPVSYVLEGVAGYGVWILIYNFWILIAIAMWPVIAVALVRELGGKRSGALAAGLVVFFPAAIQGQFSRLNIISVFWVGAVLLFYLRFLDRKKSVWAILMGLTFGACFYVSFYHAVHTLLLLFMHFGWRLFRNRSEGLRQGNGRFFAPTIVTLGLSGSVLLSFWSSETTIAVVVAVAILFLILIVDALKSAENRGFAAKGLLAGVVAGILLAPFFWLKIVDERHGDENAGMPMGAKIFWSARPMHYLIDEETGKDLSERGYLGGIANPIGFKTSGEFKIFPGYAVWFCTLAFLFLGKGIGKMKWLVFAVIFMILSLGPAFRSMEIVPSHWLTSRMILLPSYVLSKLPMMDGYRVFARMALPALLMMAIFIGLRWDGAVSVLSRKAKASHGGEWNLIRVSFLILFAVALLGERVSFRENTETVRLPAFYDRLATEERQWTLYEYPENDQLFLYPIGAHKQRLLNWFGSRETERQKRKREKSLFLREMARYEIKKEAGFEFPQSRQWEAAIRRDFLELAVDGVVVHFSSIAEKDRKKFQDFFEGTLKLENISGDGDIVFFAGEDLDLDKEKWAIAREMDE